MSAKALRWGIVGLGRIAATEIAPAISSLTNSELVAVVSRDQARADAFAVEHGAHRGLTDFDGMLGDPDIDAVYIATPNALHAAQVVAAARAGKHVLCDKPLATSVADARQAIDACATSGVHLGMTFQTRFHDGMTEIAELIRSGGIGRVVIAQVEMSAGRKLPKGWRTDPKLAGLGTINNIGVHGFDLLRYLLGAEVTEVAVLVDREPGFDVDTAATVLLRFDNSTIAYVNANQAVPNPQDDVVFYGTDGRIVGRNLSRPNRQGTLEVLRSGSEETNRKVSTAGAYTATVGSFADAVLAGRSPSPSGLDGLRSVQLTEAIATALDDRRTVPVDL